MAFATAFIHNLFRFFPSSRTPVCLTGAVVAFMQPYILIELQRRSFGRLFLVFTHYVETEEFFVLASAKNCRRFTLLDRVQRREVELFPETASYRRASSRFLLLAVFSASSFLIICQSFAILLETKYDYEHFDFDSTPTQPLITYNL